MRIGTTIVLTLILMTLTASAGTKRQSAVARLCGNVVVYHTAKTKLFERMQAEGCEDIRFVSVGDGYYLGYGTRVLQSE